MTTRTRHQPNFDEFLKVLWRSERPDHLPVYEHQAMPGFIERATGEPVTQMDRTQPVYWRVVTRFWLDLGADGVPLEIPLSVPVASRSLSRSTGTSGQESERDAVISTHEDFERFPWPSMEAPIDYRPFEAAARELPEGMKLVAGVGRGPFEWTTRLMGVQGLSLALYQQPDLVARVFERVGELVLAANHHLASLDCVGALRQGDDLGFKTGTFLSPEALREYVFPIYRCLTDNAHAAGKPFILHSCGQLETIYDDLIDECRIDAKHSFEDVILPVGEFKRRYGRRVTPLGGLDVDMICRGTEEVVRAYTRKAISDCWDPDGFWAIGTGNQLTQYMPVENYMWVIDEARRVTS